MVRATPEVCAQGWRAGRGRTEFCEALGWESGEAEGDPELALGVTRGRGTVGRRKGTAGDGVGEGAGEMVVQSGIWDHSRPPGGLGGSGPGLGFTVGWQ